MTLRRIRAAVPTGAYLGWCLGVLTTTVVLAGSLGLTLGGRHVSQIISNVALAAAALIAAGACFWSATRVTGRTRWAWALLGASPLSWGIGRGLWTWYEPVLGDAAPFPSLAAIGHLGMTPFCAAGLLMIPMASQTLANRARSVLDGLMIAGSLLLVSWVLVLDPLLRARGDSPRALPISLAYPIGDVVTVTIVLYMLARSHKSGRVPIPLALVGAGLVTFAVSDSAFAYLTLIGAYSSGAPIDLGWFVGSALIVLAAVKPRPTSVEARPRLIDGGPLGALLPYLAVLAAVTTSTVDLLHSGQVDPFVSWTRTAIILLMLGRQVLTMLENLSLTRHLEARVADRTAELRASEQRFQALVQHSSDVVTVVDVHANVLYQSESISRVFGYPAVALAGEPLTTLLDPHAGARLLEALGQVARRPYATHVLELTMRHSDGHLCQAEMTITNLLDTPSVGGLVLNTRDISERKELERQLVHEAFHDSLTALANRALFKDRVDQALRRSDSSHTAVGVLFLDLDGFKEVNDSLGHASGDQLLIQVAERLRASVRPQDTVARFGGDEFAVLIDVVEDGLETVQVARRIVEGLHEPFRLETQEIHVRGSIGIATTGVEEHVDAGAGGTPTMDAADLLRNADLAMYRAKAAGDGGYARYDPRMHTGLVERLQLEKDLRRALDADELELFYQPTIELLSGEIIGFEALARWRHPVRGLISPTEFIPLAEATGLIRPLGRWVLAQACRQAVAWGAGQPGRRLTMAVNVSGRQFDQPNLREIVAEILAETGMPAESLCLEMTESVLMNDTAGNLTLLTHLKEMGVRLAIDDFGTGYSSLSYLHRFPVDTLKIDRSFIERLGQHPEEAALARTIVQLGQSLGMVTVAEGIEDHSQFLALRQMTCDLGQGFYFSGPIPPAEAGRLLSRNLTEHSALLVTAPAG